VNIFTTVLI